MVCVTVIELLFGYDVNCFSVVKGNEIEETIEV